MAVDETHKEEGHKEEGHKEEGKKHDTAKKASGFIEKYIWYILGGGLGLVGVVFYFLTSKSSSSSGSGSGSSQTATAIPVSGGGIAGGSYPSANMGSNSSTGTGMTGGAMGGYGSSILSSLQSQKTLVGKLQSQLSALQNQYNNQSGFSSKQQGAINHLSSQIKNLQDSIHAAQKTTSAGTQPVTSPTKNYIVQSGNTLSGIAAAHGMSLTQLENANKGITNPNLIYPGQKITL